MQDEMAMYRRATITLTGDHERAPRDAVTSIALAEALLRLAQRTADPAERISLLERAVKADPYDARARRALALARRHCHDLPGAIAALRAAVALDPGNPALALDLALLRLAQLRQRPGKDLAKHVIAEFEDILAMQSCTPERARIAHVGRLVAAVHAPVVGPTANRLRGLLPDALLAVEPDSAWLGLIVWLGTAMAFTAYFRKPQQKPPKTDELRERRKMLDSLSAGLAPWLAAFPDDRGLRSTDAAIAILACSDDAIAQTIAAQGSDIADPRLLHLFVRERLSELEAGKRIEALTAIDRLRPLSSGLDRELVSSLHHSARACVCRGDSEPAAALWKQALGRDPYNPALHHNLALVALARRDGTEFTARLRTTLDLSLSYWLLRGGRADGLRYVAAKHESFAARLRKTIESSLTAETGHVAPGIVGAWCGEMLASLVIRAIALAFARRSPATAVIAELLRYVRELPPLLDDGGALPEAFASLVDPVIEGEPPLHYETLGVSLDAPPSTIQKRYAELIEELDAQRMRARMSGRPAMVERIARRIAQVKAAHVELSDVARRRRYDSACISPDEHAYHLARRSFVDDVFEFAHRLHQRKLFDSVPMLLRAYSNLPHARMDVYFEAAEPNKRMLMWRALFQLRFQPLLDRVQTLMHDEAWAEAHELLALVLESGGAELRYVHYLAAVCELHLERAHVEAHGGLSDQASSSITRNAARTRLAALPPSADDDDEDT